MCWSIMDDNQLGQVDDPPLLWSAIHFFFKIDDDMDAKHLQGLVSFWLVDLTKTVLLKRAKNPNLASASISLSLAHGGQGGL